MRDKMTKAALLSEIADLEEKLTFKAEQHRVCKQMLDLQTQKADHYNDEAYRLAAECRRLETDLDKARDLVIDSCESAKDAIKGIVTIFTTKPPRTRFQDWMGSDPSSTVREFEVPS